jgi:ribonuclease HI
MNVHHAETLACFRGIDHATRMGLDKIIVEMDAATVVDVIRISESDRSPLAMMFRKIYFSVSCLPLTGL